MIHSAYDEKIIMETSVTSMFEIANFTSKPRLNSIIKQVPTRLGFDELIYFRIGLFRMKLNERYASLC